MLKDEVVGFFTDIGLNIIKNRIKRTDSDWNEFINYVKNIVKETCEKFRNDFTISHDHKDVIFTDEYIKQIVDAVFIAINDDIPFTVDMVLPYEQSLPKVMKTQLHTKITSDLNNFSYEYFKRTKLSEIALTTDRTEKKVDDIHDFFELIAQYYNKLTDISYNHIKPLRSNCIKVSGFDVIGRDNMVSELDSVFRDNNVVSLHGDGGIGKSILADYYADKSNFGFITKNYIQFSEDIKTTLINLGTEWRLPNYDVIEHEEKLNFVKARLNEQKDKILIIIDINDVNISVINDVENLQFDENVKFLITTRINELLACRQIEVLPLSSENIKTLFINYAKITPSEIEENIETFSEIVKDIYCENTMLIALVAKVKAAEQLNFTELYQAIKDSPLITSRDPRPKLPRSRMKIDEDTLKNHIINLYNITHLSDEQKYFIQNMSLMDYSGVQLKKFNEWMELATNNTEVSLENNCFIHYEINSDGDKIIYMHPAVSDAVFEQSGNDIKLYNKIISNLCKSEFDDYIYKKKRLVLIIEFMIKRFEKSQPNNRLIDLYDFMIQICEAIGEYDKALFYCKQNVSNCEKLYGVDDFSTVYAYGLLADIYYDLREYETSLNIYEKILLVIKDKYQFELDYTATIYDNIGGIYEKFDQFNLALSKQKEALEIRQYLYGFTNIRTIGSYANIGTTYDCMNKHELSLLFVNFALFFFELIEGSFNPSVANTLNTIGLIYEHLGEYHYSAIYYHRALKIYKYLFNDENPDVMRVLANINRLKNKFDLSGY